MVAINQTKEVALRIMESLDRRDLDGVVSNAAPDATWYGFAPMPLDNDGYKQAMSGILNGFSDSRFPVGEIIVEGDRAAVRHRLQGTHNGTFLGIPPTGKQVEIDGIVMLRLEDGKVKEAWLSADNLGMLTQLGVVPAPGQ